jgi:hypothetical protein
MSAAQTALLWNGGAAAGGAAVGALTNTSAPLPNALGGATAMLGLTTLGGLIVALVSKENRDAALATAGIGLLGIVVFGVGNRIASP